MSIGFDDERVRADFVFGAEDRSDPVVLRELYREALRQLQAAERKAVLAHAEADRLGWDNAGLRTEVRKLRMSLDRMMIATVAKAARGDA